MPNINSLNGGLVTNPAELALPYVSSIGPPATTNSEKEERLLAELDLLSTASSMDGRYFTQTGRALAVPVSFDAEQPVDYWSFDNLTFEGKLSTYSIVQIGKIIGGNAVKALCLTFDEVLLLPYFDHMEETDLLHVPVLAVDSMTRTDAA